MTDYIYIYSYPTLHLDTKSSKGTVLLLLFCISQSQLQLGLQQCTCDHFDWLVFNATFNNISAILWQSVLLVEETRVPGDLTQITDKLSHNVLSRTPRPSRKEKI